MFVLLINQNYINNHPFSQKIYFLYTLKFQHHLDLRSFKIFYLYRRIRLNLYCYQRFLGLFQLNYEVHFRLIIN